MDERSACEQLDYGNEKERNWEKLRRCRCNPRGRRTPHHRDSRWWSARGSGGFDKKANRITLKLSRCITPPGWAIRLRLWLYVTVGIAPSVGGRLDRTPDRWSLGGHVASTRSDCVGSESTTGFVTLTRRTRGGIVLEKIWWYASFPQRYINFLQLDSTSRAVVKDRLTYLTPVKLRRLQNALEETQAVDGEILEFGVALGGSGIILAKHADGLKAFRGFDVFGMIPPPTSDKDDAKSRDRYETIRSGASSGIQGDEYYGYKRDLYSEVSASFARHGVPVDDANVFLYRGLFEQTWPTAKVQSISLAHIDCDWYDPVKFCLKACADRVTKGGIIIIDDYHDYGGCRVAVNEFVEEHPGFIFEDGPNPFLRKQFSSSPQPLV
jgi:O-methyltransferase